MFAKVFLFLALIAVAAAFAPRSAIARMAKQSSVQLSEKIKITDNVQFETIAREWRLKWSPDNDKKALSSVQQTVEVFLPQIKGIAGVKSVQRIVCGGCMDYKVVIALPASAWGKWEVRLFCSLQCISAFSSSCFLFLTSPHVDRNRPSGGEVRAGTFGWRKAPTAPRLHLSPHIICTPRTHQEEQFLAALKSIPGLSNVETQVRYI